MAELVKARKKKVKLKLGISAPSGGGKTLSALFIAFGMLKEKYPTLTEDEIWDKIAVIDTENESASLYAECEKAKIKIGSFNVINLKPPYSPNEYVDAIRTCENSGTIEVAIVDSLTHAWAGEGGLLDKQANASKKSGNNSYTAWREVTPLHNRLVDSILQSDIHVIATIRSKTDYVIDKDSDGRTTIKKVGLAPIQRDGMEYEFTTFFDIDREHNCSASKDRTGLFDDLSFVITPDTGKKFMRWLDAGIEAPRVEKVKVEEKPADVTVDELKANIKEVITAMSVDDKKNMKNKVEAKNLPLDYNKIEDLELLVMYFEVVSEGR